MIATIYTGEIYLIIGLFACRLILKLYITKTKLVSKHTFIHIEKNPTVTIQQDSPIKAQHKLSPVLKSRITSALPDSDMKINKTSQRTVDFSKRIKIITHDMTVPKREKIVCRSSSCMRQEEYMSQTKEALTTLNIKHLPLSQDSVCRQTAHFQEA